MFNLINNKSSCFIKYLFIIFLPFFVYPVFALLSIVFDAIFGDSFSILSALYDSHSILLAEFVEAWLYSMPYTALIVWCMYAVIKLIVVRTTLNIFKCSLLIGVLPGALLSTFLYHSSIYGIIITISVSVMLSIILYLLSLSIGENNCATKE